VSYMRIINLYKDQRVLAFRKVFAMEKIHGTSAHVSWKNGVLNYFPGGESLERFKKAFDEQDLIAKFVALGHPEVVVFGEAYGGSQQGMSHTYGKDLKFVAFEAKVGDTWLCVPDAEDVAHKLGLDFVPYKLVSSDIASLDAERDAFSVQAVKNGMGDGHLREGIVIRPEFEVKTSDGERIVAKHKSDKFQETATPRKVVDPSKLLVMAEANAIAHEWCTEMRLSHVLDAFPDADITMTGKVIAAMKEDIAREAAGEIVESKEAWAIIGRKTAEMFKARLKVKLNQLAQ
jgi:hypothetical protein